VIILCNPQNPTGNVWSRDDLAMLGEICTRRRVVVLADEFHCDFVGKGARYTPFASLGNEKIVMNSITLKSASKSFNLAAMKCAYMFSRNGAYLDRVRAVHRDEINTLGMVAHRAAFTDGDSWMDQVIPYIDANQAFTEQFIRSKIPLIRFTKPQGTYLAWLDVSGVIEKIGARQQADEANSRRNPSAPVMTPTRIVERYFVEKARVHMNAGAPFGVAAAAGMRMNIGTSRKTLELALNNLAQALEKA
jgi:cystathionine beta-lyase